MEYLGGKHHGEQHGSKQDALASEFESGKSVGHQGGGGHSSQVATTEMKMEFLKKVAKEIFPKPFHPVE